MAMIPEFRAAAAAEAVAHILLWSDGSRDRYSLMKIVYLAERKALEKHKWPIFFDKMICMRFGMVPQGIFDLIRSRETHPEWDRYVERAVEDDYVVYMKNPPRSHTHLSPAQADLLRQAYEDNANKSFGQLKEEGHRLPEWEHPGDSSIRRTMPEILKAIGYVDSDIESLLKTMACERQLEDIINGDS